VFSPQGWQKNLRHVGITQVLVSYRFYNGFNISIPISTQKNTPDAVQHVPGPNPVVVYIHMVSPIYINVTI